MIAPSKPELVPRNLLDYQNDAKCLIEYYCNPKISEHQPGRYYYLTTNLLHEYVRIRNYSYAELTFVKILIQSTSRSTLDPGISTKFKMKLVNKKYDSKVLRLLKDLNAFINAPEFLSEVDGTY